ncbi:MAG: TonB-dependent receptor [Comamonadaceae bacterium]|nr:MAG: TonB-dependent receptor [Comamonadaceae bacterium]
MRSVLALVAFFLPALCAAQEGILRPVVITGATADNQRWTAPASIDVIEGDEIRNGQLQINLSESLGRVPGLTLQNRQNYAQDLQVSIRGFGARSTFGVRGIRLFVDGIPASAPDGQGQTSNFPLGSADRIEVIRGPYSALYGSSAGGVIALYTADGGTPEWRGGFAAGADGLWRLSTQANGQVGTYNYAIDASSFSTDGYRPQSAAERDSARLKLSRTHEDGRIVMLLDRQVSQALDPLGLSRPEFNANARQVTPGATQFNTRKSVEQTQLGLAVQQRLGGGHQLELMGYVGQRALVQYQAIPTASQAAPGSPGGIIDLDRTYWGLNARWRLDRQYEGGKLTASAGLAIDRQDEDRRGFENFQGAGPGAALGVQGRLRRDEANRATTLDPYAQVEWDSAAWTATAGVRRSTVKLSSADRYVAPGNANDSGAVEYAATNPVLGLRYKLSPTLQAYASAGKGFETPTLNEVAYRAFGATGLNTSLGASRSRSVEAGLRGRDGGRTWTATVFDILTKDEIVVLSNTGGRSTFQNAGRTRRRGLELSGEAALGKFTLSSALTLMNATYADAFTTCDAAPCAAPNLVIPAGNRLPGIPRRQAYVQVAWEPGWAGSTFTLELRHNGDVPVNDRNSDAAAAYTVANLGVRFQQDSGEWRLREFVRIDNLANRKYAGSVIVNEGNGRFFETAPGRTLYVGMELVRRFK